MGRSDQLIACPNPSHPRTACCTTEDSDQRVASLIPRMQRVEETVMDERSNRRRCRRKRGEERMVLARRAVGSKSATIRTTVTPQKTMRRAGDLSVPMLFTPQTGTIQPVDSGSIQSVGHSSRAGKFTKTKSQASSNRQ